MDLAFLGTGVLTPMQRGETGFAMQGGVEHVKAAVAQILSMPAGELPWDSQRGSLLERLRHSNNDELRKELARHYVLDTLARWEPRVSVTDIKVSVMTSNANAMLIQLRFDVISRNVPGNNVLVRGVLMQTLITV